MNAGDNYFEFVIHPEILNVYFNKMVLKQVEEGLQGKHPLLKGEEFFYRKEN